MKFERLAWEWYENKKTILKNQLVPTMSLNCKIISFPLWVTWK